MALFWSNTLQIATPCNSKLKPYNPKLMVPKTSQKNLHPRKNSYLPLLVKCLKAEINSDESEELLSVLPGLRFPSSENKVELRRKDFPHDFIFGASTSALQTEGPGNEGGRGKSTWDSMIEADKGRIAVDSYHLYKEDVKMLKEMGMKAYRFSISWPRILPNGTINGGINQKGIEFYNNLINELVANGITPIATLLHFDLPQVLQDKYKGFLGHEIIEQFKEYAELCFQKFGDRVKFWGTINEPLIYAFVGEKLGIPPELQTDHLAPYIFYHNVLLAHSTVAKLYKQKYKGSQGGKIGISLPMQWTMPYSPNPMDVAANEASLEMGIGWFMNPLVHGDYSEWMKNHVPGLPKLTSKQRNLVKNAFDYIGINYYTSRYMQHKFSYDALTGEVTFTSKSRIANDQGKVLGWQSRGSETEYCYPDGLKQLLLHMKHKYGNPEVYITENGVSSKPIVTGSIKELLNQGKLEELETIFYDDFRLEYVQGHLKAVLDARREGANVKGYVVWSLLDDMEMGSGYDVRIGLTYIDYFDNCARYPKKSAKWFATFLKSKPLYLQEDSGGEDEDEDDDEEEECEYDEEEYEDAESSLIV